MFNGIIAIILLVILILFIWKKWQKKQNHVAAMVLPNVRNIQSNPNIGCDGRNVNIIGTTGTIFIITLYFVLILINIMYVNGWKTFAFIEKIVAIGPFLVPSLLLPGLFYLNKPGSIAVIRDTFL